MNSSSVLEIFKEITKIPRESGHEAPMTAFLQQWAQKHNLECKTDSTGNVLIIKEASKGKENVPTLVLQGHQDMVCEKTAGSTHDFTKDPIEYVIEDGWMIAKDTTLGADDGIGIAASLAILESDLPTGRIECLFTISEETGMDGAIALEEGFFKGKTLINLDSEDEGEMFVGCAGGVNTGVQMKYKSEAFRKDWERMDISINGATGGHSGDDINKGRLNAVKELALFINEERNHGLQLCTFTGGGKRNAIARDCCAEILVPSADATAKRFEKWAGTLKAEHSGSDPGVEFFAKKTDSTKDAISKEDTDNFIEALCECPHGVIKMSPDIEGLVQTSTNLASVRMNEEGVIDICTSQRSSVMDELWEIAGKVAGIFKKYGAQTEHDNPYPGWNPNMKSGILKTCVESYESVFGVKPAVKAIHAGLECGLFLEKFPDLDMISFGPTLRGVHAPGEKLELASLDKFTKHLVDVVCNFK